MPVPVYVHRWGRLLYLNEAALAVLNGMGMPGSTVEDYQELDVFSLVCDEDRAQSRQAYERIMRSGRARPRTPRVAVSPAGERFEVHGAVRPLDWDGEPALAVVLTHVDPLLPMGAVEGEADRRRRRLLQSLTQRERQVVDLAAKGFSTVNIATLLGIAENTVRNHLRAAYRKTGTHSRLELSHLFRR